MSSESPKTPIKGDNDEHTTSPPTDPCAWNDSGNVPCLYVRDRHTKDTMVVPETPDDVVLSMDDNLYPISTYSRRRKLFQSPSRLGDIDEKNISKNYYHHHYQFQLHYKTIPHHHHSGNHVHQHPLPATV